MLDERSKEKLRRWLQDDHTWYFRLWMSGGAFWYNKMPKRLRFWGVIHLLFRAAVIAAAPMIAAFEGTITTAIASVVAAALIVLNLATTLADRLSKAGAKSPDFATEGLVRVGDLLSSYKADAVKAGNHRETAMGACLGIIESIALPITGSQMGAISVNLILYTGAGTGWMTVRKRNPGNSRPENRQFQTERILGHYVCQRGEAPLTINHIKHFGKEFAASPTQTSYDYRSILLMPLLCDNGSGLQARGFVSIDCDQPYAFYGNRANSIAILSKPIIDQLRKMI